MKRGWACVLASTLLASLGAASSAHAQFRTITPAFSKLTGGYIWGSFGHRSVVESERFTLSDQHPIIRGGFAALIGPFGGEPDTLVSLDSVRTSVEWMPVAPRTPGATRADTVRTTRVSRSHYTQPGRDGWVSLAVGYAYSANYSVDLHADRGTLASTFPVAGFYVAAMFGPYPIWQLPPSLFWYGSLGATRVRLKSANGTSDGTLVRFDTEPALAPEASLLVGWRVHSGIRVIGGIGAQHIRWSSIRYRAPSELPLPDADLRRLPDGLRLTSMHLNLGVTFDAGDLFGK